MIKVYMKYIRLFVLCLALTAWGCTGAELSPDGVGDGTEEIPGDSDGGNGGSGDEGGNNGGGEETPLEYFYKRVDVEPLDWSGDYLIAYDNGTELMLLDSWSDNSGKSTKSFGISDFDAAGGGIPAEKGDSYKAVVTKEGDSYTVNIKGIGYMGLTSSDNALHCAQTVISGDEAFLWKISLVDASKGICDIKCVKYSSRSLRWNSSAKMFRCYTSGQKPVTLLKKNGSGSGSGEGGSGGSGEGGDSGEGGNGGGDSGEGGGNAGGGDSGEGGGNTGGGDSGDGGEGGSGGETDHPSGINPEGNVNGWLVNWEMPHADVNLAANVAWTKSVNESIQGCVAYVCEDKSADRLYVTHTYTGAGSKRVRNYTMLYDKNKVCALWEAYPMHKSAYPDNNVGRSGNWKTDPAIPSSWQSAGCTNDYHKGHQVASNDRQYSKSANQQTFYLTNQSPQWQTRFNDGVWNQLELAINKGAPTGRDTLYVATGPLFEKNQTTKDNGGKTVPLPSGFWKCVMKCSFNASGAIVSAQGIGYIFENRAYTNTNYSSCSTTIDEVEKRCGFNLFANIPEAIQSKAESKAVQVF